MQKVAVISPVVETPASGLTTKVFQQRLDPYSSADLSFTSRFLSAGPSSIEGEDDEALALPDLLVQGAQAQADGFDAIAVDCMLDPGLSDLRSRLSIPVIGPFQTAATLAAMNGDRLGIMDVCEEGAEGFEQLVNAYGLGDVVAGIRPILVPVLDLAHRREFVLDRLETVATQLMAQGATALLFGCTALVEHRQELGKRLAHAGVRARIVDPVALMLRTVAAMLQSGF